MKTGRNILYGGDTAVISLSSIVEFLEFAREQEKLMTGGKDVTRHLPFWSSSIGQSRRVRRIHLHKIKQSSTSRRDGAGQTDALPSRDPLRTRQ